MRPGFLVIGSQKAGTTSLHHALDLHPEVFVPEAKELCFFYTDEEVAKGLDHYERHFDPAPAEVKAIGEASPGYICFPGAADRIAATLPDAKLILTVRNPIDRGYSQYWDNRRRLAEQMRWPDAVAQLTGDPVFRPGKLGYVARGVYMQYVRRYLERFPREQLLMVVFDDLKADFAGVMRRIFEFIGVDPEVDVPVQKRNPASMYKNPAARWFFEHPAATRGLPRPAKSALLRGSKETFRTPPMDPATRAKLVEFYRPYNAELSAFLGRELDWDR